MFTKRQDWRRWSGPRTDIRAAVDIASAELQKWSGIPAKVDIRISYNNQLSQNSDDPATLDNLHSTDLHRVRDLWIDVDIDRAWWRETSSEYDRRRIELTYDGKPEEAALLPKPPELMTAAVALRLEARATAGMRLVVIGPERANVEGLTTMLVEVLNRSAGPKNPTGPLGFGEFLAAASVVLAFGLSYVAVHVLHLAPIDNHYQWQEIVFPFGAAIIVGASWFAYFWAFPTIELLDSAERSRFQRYRTSLLTWFVAVIGGLIATAIWAAIT